MRSTIRLHWLHFWLIWNLNLILPIQPYTCLHAIDTAAFTHLVPLLWLLWADLIHTHTYTHTRWSPRNSWAESEAKGVERTDDLGKNMQFIFCIHLFMSEACVCHIKWISFWINNRNKMHKCMPRLCVLVCVSSPRPRYGCPRLWTYRSGKKESCTSL